MTQFTEQPAPQASTATGVSGADIERHRPETPEERRQRLRSARSAAIGFWIEASLALVATIVAGIGLAGWNAVLLASAAIIILATEMLIASRVRRYAARTKTRERSMAEVGAVSVEYLVGGPSIVLGVLAVAGVVPLVLAASATLLFGVALMFGGTEVSRQANLSTMYPPPNPPDDKTLRTLEIVAGVQMVAGIAAVILAILSLVGVRASEFLLLAIAGLGLSRLLGSAATAMRMRKVA